MTEYLPGSFFQQINDKIDNDIADMVAMNNRMAAVEALNFSNINTRLNNIETGLLSKAGTDVTNSLNTRLTAAESAINGKANTVHTHNISDISGLQAVLDAKASNSSLTNGLALKADITVTTSLNTRLTAAESSIVSCGTRLNALEARSLGTSKSANVAKVTTVPTATMGVSILGTSVVTETYAMQLQAEVENIRIAVNKLIDVDIAQNLMVA